MANGGERIALTVYGSDGSHGAVLFVAKDRFDRIELLVEDLGLTLAGVGPSLSRCLDHLRRQPQVVPCRWRATN